MRRRAALAALPALVGCALVAPGPAGASAPGVLTQVGCVQRNPPAGAAPACTPARGLDNTAFLALSPDGRNLYATGRDSDSLASFRRDPRTGLLTQLPDPAGCLRDDRGSAAEAGCTPVAMLDRPSSVLVSSDGRFVYVTATDGNGVAVFARSAGSGVLTPAGCLTATGPAARPGCTPTPGLEGPVGLAVSPDGGHLYVAASRADAVLTLRRDATTGALTPVQCLREEQSGRPPEGCQTGMALRGATSVAVAPDGRSVYATAPFSSAVIAFARDAAGGALTQIGCVSGDIEVRRDPRCTSGRGIQFAQNVTVSPDGRHVYAAATDSHVIALFSRDAGTGAIAQPPGADGCLSDFTDGPAYCRSGLGLALPLGLAFGEGGRVLYTGAFGYGAVAAFERDEATGQLDQAGPCLSGQDVDCAKAGALERAGFVAVSPDGRHLYANATSSDAVSVFAIGRRVELPDVVGRAGRRPRGLRLVLACPAEAVGGCLGQVTPSLSELGLRRAPGPPIPFDLAPGGRAALTVPLGTPERRLVREGRRVRLSVLVSVEDQAGSSVRDYRRSVAIGR